jgi:hypothetical protein
MGLSDKRKRLGKLMKDAGRWSSSYQQVIDNLPEPVLDELLAYYDVAATPRLVW